MAGTEINKVETELRNQCVLLAMQALIARNEQGQNLPVQVAELAYRFVEQMVSSASRVSEQHAHNYGGAQ